MEKNHGMRRLVRWPLLALLLCLGISHSWANDTAEPRFHASILLYHHVSSSTPPSTSLSPRQFAEHLEMLERDGFEVWPLPRVIQHLQRRRPMPDRVAVLTFDDAYISVYENALPLMRERNLPFTIFVNAQFIEERRPLYMSWAQLREAQQAGGTIANHSLTHPYMVRRDGEESDAAWEARMRAEIEDNQRLLEERLGNVPRLFAYPYGEYTPELEAIVASLGYVAFGQHSGPASPFSRLTAIPRYAANGVFANPATLRTKLHALPFPVVEDLPASDLVDGARPRPTWTFTMEAGDYRLNQLRCYGPQSRLLNTDIERAGEGRVRVTVTDSTALNPGRSRFNCTAPHRTENRYFWLSRQWLVPRPDGSWGRQ
ncbi:polysaccharide deacetylase family protein [Marinospirillum sp. MEB164]|uniref:Polysaccharide deacetylase family protein n=1 Tax=Marinospirillum alkalitolerans TaxID=3123374 RepID=A0ABW8PU53_9GAMM